MTATLIRPQDAGGAEGLTFSDALAAVNGLIKQGPLPGNGCDEQAQRNGIVMAHNALFNLAHPNLDKPQPDAVPAECKHERVKVNSLPWPHNNYHKAVCVDCGHTREVGPFTAYSVPASTQGDPVKDGGDCECRTCRPAESAPKKTWRDGFAAQASSVPMPEANYSAGVLRGFFGDNIDEGAVYLSRCKTYGDARAAEVTAPFSDYLKDGETPIQRFERERRDTGGVLRLLAREKVKVEALMEALNTLAEFAKTAPGRLPQDVQEALSQAGQEGEG